MKKYSAQGPNGKRYELHADNEDALKSALAELFPAPPPPPPDRAAQTVELLTKLVEKEPPPHPEPPEPAELDLTPVVDALRRLEAKDAPATDLKPLAAQIEELGGRITRLTNAVAKANDEQHERHSAVIDAIEQLRRVMCAPRRLVRENGRPVASVVDLDGTYDDRTLN
jgi:hypothetical protein